MSATNVQPGTASVIFQIKQQTSGYHVRWVQGVKGKDRKTKETHGTRFLSHCISYQIHTRETRSGRKERKIENKRTQGDYQIALHRLKGDSVWGLIPNEVCCTCTTRTTVALSPRAN